MWNFPMTAFFSLHAACVLKCAAVAALRGYGPRTGKRFGPPQSDDICRESGEIVCQKRFEFRVSEMAFAPLSKT